MKSNANLFIFCTGEKDYIQEHLISRFGDKVLYPGWLPSETLNLYLSACSLFILPLNDSKRNLGRWPIKFNEFVFFRRPIITSINHDVSKFFPDNKSIFTYNSLEINSIENIIEMSLKVEIPVSTEPDLYKLDIHEKVNYLSKLFVK
jgi:glycosyltransferase involved in cell wall biosynthesis